jgi:hypothetical protein
LDSAFKADASGLPSSAIPDQPTCSNHPTDRTHSVIATDRMKVWKGKIETLKVDIIVNAANSTLRGGGGVDKAIRNAAGIQLTKELNKLKGCEVGHSKITPSYNIAKKGGAKGE